MNGPMSKTHEQIEQEISNRKKQDKQQSTLMKRI